MSTGGQGAELKARRAAALLSRYKHSRPWTSGLCRVCTEWRRLSSPWSQVQFLERIRTHSDVVKCIVMCNQRFWSAGYDKVQG